MTTYGPTLPPGYAQPEDERPRTGIGLDRENGNQTVDGKAAVESVLSDTTEATSKPKPVIGPELPPGFQRFPVSPELVSKAPLTRVLGPTLPAELAREDVGSEVSGDEEEDDYACVGPSPTLMVDEYSASAAMVDRLERQERRLAEAAMPQAPQREAWMTDLPEELLGRNVVPTTITGPRTFKRRTDEYEADFSGWTAGPDGKKPKQSKEKKELSSLERLETEQSLQREKMLEKEVEKHNQQKRADSLVSIAQKNTPGKDTSVRRPFDREKDLSIQKVGRMDKEDIVRRASELQGRFSTSAKPGQKFL
ncbi:hypothetical protein RvY_13121 [Ramazzottius varieornatus]|uniref:DUF3752 domain-containing protein n=1 Tax=Ramazzottius varieornatus TaxID=947166 RepID=A0A1D1VLV8_RAMVA|nr:hypothetical protein RvY_13121 [Ramazzottius varieornatus]